MFGLISLAYHFLSHRLSLSLSSPRTNRTVKDILQMKFSPQICWEENGGEELKLNIYSA